MAARVVVAPVLTATKSITYPCLEHNRGLGMFGRKGNSSAAVFYFAVIYLNSETPIILKHYLDRTDNLEM